MTRISLYFSFITLMLLSFQTNAQKLDHILGDVLIKLADDHSIEDVIARNAVYEGQASKLEVVDKLSKQMNIWQLHFDYAHINEFRFKDHLSADEGILVIQVNHIITNRQTVPDDPNFSNQWQWVDNSDHDVDAELAWDITTGGLTPDGDEIVVAVFDDGGDLDHPDLIDNNWVNTHEIPNNGIDDDGNGFTDDVYGWNFGANNNNVDNGDHGVAVAGMVGAVGNNGIGGTGINWNVKIMNIRRGGVGESAVVQFYSYALDHRERYNDSNGEEGAFVVATNSSWGFDGADPDDFPIWCGFYDTLGEEGILSCGATSNSNINVDVIGDMPTSCPSEYLISVTATDDNDVRTFSGYGPINIDIGAPGEQIYTTEPGGGYSSTTGTSFASPLVAGVVALMYAAPCSNLPSLALSNPALAAEMVRDYIYAGVDVVPALTGEVLTDGRINAYNSIVMMLADCGPCPRPHSFEITDNTDSYVTVEWVESDSAQSLNLRYREVGAANWIDVNDVEQPYDIEGLSACTLYELQVEAICTDTTSSYSDIFEFTSEGCCSAPFGLDVVNITNGNATANWTAVFAAESYNIRYKRVTDTDWIETTATTNTVNISNLIDCGEYELQVETVCANNVLSGYSASDVFSTECECITPTNLDTSSVNVHVINLIWDETATATAYTVRYKKLGGSPNWTLLSTPDANASLIDLDSCANYQVQVKSDCVDDQSAYTSTFIVKTRCIVPVATHSIYEDINAISIAPNPFSDQIEIQLNLKHSNMVSYEIVNVKGQSIYQNEPKLLPIGDHTIVANLEHLSAGLYFIKVSTEDGMIVKKILKN